METSSGSNNARKSSLETTPCVASELVCKPLGPYWLLIDPAQPAWLVGNAMARDIVSLCDGSRTLDDIADAIADEYEQPREIVRSHVSSFLAEAEHSGIVAYSEAPKARSPYRGPLPIKSVLLCINEQCNLQCLHCYNSSDSLKTGVLTRSEVRRLVTEIKQAGATHVGLSGGEPLLHPQFWRILADVEAADMSVTVNTNGTLLDVGTVARFAEHTCVVKVSLDGARADTHDRIRGQGRFAQAIAALRRLRASLPRKRLAVSFTPNGLNCGDLEAMLALAEELDVARLHISLLIGSGRARLNRDHLGLTRDQMTRFLTTLALAKARAAEAPDRLQISGGCADLLDNRTPVYSCGFGVGPCIDASGNVYGCEAFTDPAYRLGNIREEARTLTDIVFSSRTKSLRDRFAERMQRDECRSCHYRNYCGGTCAAEAYALTGDILGRSHLCDGVQVSVMAYFKERCHLTTT